MFEIVTKRVKNRIKSVAHYDKGIDIAENRAISYNTTLLDTLRVRICAWISCAWKMANTPIPHTPRTGVLLVIGVVLFLAACWALPTFSAQVFTNSGFDSDLAGWAGGGSGWHAMDWQSEGNPGGSATHGGVGIDDPATLYQLYHSSNTTRMVATLCYDVQLTGTWDEIGIAYSIVRIGARDSAGGDILIDGDWVELIQDSIPLTGLSSWTHRCTIGTFDSTHSDYGAGFLVGARPIIFEFDNVTLDLTEVSSESSCAVSDPGFASSSSWTPSATGATYSSGQWNLAPGGTIQQDVYLPVGVYTPTIAARTTSGSAILNFGMYLTSTAPITITSSSWSYYYSSINASVANTYTVRLEADPDNASSIVIDSVCFAPSLAPGLPSDWANCGLTQADLNTNVFQNPSLDAGWGYQNPLYGGIDLWFPTSWAVGSMDRKHSPGYSFSTAAVGLLNQSYLQGGDRSLSQQLPSSLNKFNVVMMVKRLESDATLNVAYNNGAWWNPTTVIQGTISNTTLNEWQPVGIWFDLPQLQNWRIYFTSPCPSCGSSGDGYVIDEVYAIPGTSAVVCASSPPPPNPQPVPGSGCINGNAHMAGPDGTYQMTYGSAVDGIGYPWVWSWHGRMGTLTPWEHVARLFPTTGYDAYAHQYMPAAYGDVSREYSGVLADRQYDVFGSIIGYQAPSDSGPIQPSTATVSIGNSSGSTFSFDVTIDSNQPSTTFWQTFTATQGMFAGPCSEGDSGGCNISFDINNRGGTSALIDLACVRPFSMTIPIPTDPPTGTACLGSWDRSEVGGGLGYVEVGTYLYSSQTLNGDYRLWIAGEADDTGVLRVMYMNISTGITVALGAMNVVSGNNMVNTTFVTPPSGYYGGQVIVEPSVGITITAACLQSSAIPPVDPPGTPPIVIPMPTCGSVNFGATSPWITNTIGFYGRPPYTETAIMSGTLYSDVNWAEYMAMQTYNYAIYPLVCTTISVANWQVEAYNALMAFLAQHIGTIQPPGGNSCGTGIWAVLCELIKVIGNTIGQIVSLLQNVLDLLLVVLNVVGALLGLLIQLLGIILGLVLNLLGQIIGLLSQLMGMVQGNDATAYTTVTCDGDMEGFCIGLGLMIVLDQYAGQYISPVIYVGLAALSILLIVYLIDRIRGMFQPGEN